MNKLIQLTLVLLTAVTLYSCRQTETLSDAYGNFEAIETIVSSLGTGQLQQFTPQEGDQLQSGVVVGYVDTIDLSLRKAQMLSQKQAVLSRLLSVNAQLNVQKQQMQNTKVDQQRINKLFDEGAATQKQKDDLDGAVQLIERQMKATLAQVESIQSEARALDAQVDQVKESIRKSILLNPVDGVVLSKFAENGEVVSYGKPLYKIADLSVLELRVYVSGAQLSQFAVGDDVAVLIDKNKDEITSLKGKISWVSASAEFTPKTIQTRDERVDLVYAVKVRVVNNGQLKIGMPGEIIFKH